jgi:catechol 2,3-dioxygenase-like lactoylglutathione lyase family enzyme
MSFTPKAIRPFLGASNYKTSRDFYRALGFEEVVIGDKMCLFKVNENLSFYLQDYYVEDWVGNTMVSLEVDDLEKCAAALLSKGLPQEYPQVKFTEIKQHDWGKELFLTDPSGVLWHFCEFSA